MTPSSAQGGDRHAELERKAELSAAADAQHKAAAAELQRKTAAAELAAVTVKPRVAQAAPVIAPSTLAPSVPAAPRGNPISFKGSEGVGDISIALGNVRITEGLVTQTHAELILDGVAIDTVLDRKLDVLKFGSPLRSITIYRDPRDATGNHHGRSAGPVDTVDPPHGARDPVALQGNDMALKCGGGGSGNGIHAGSIQEYAHSTAARRIRLDPDVSNPTTRPCSCPLIASVSLALT